MQATTTSTERARDLRNAATPPEKLLWQYLRRKQLGLRFRRQHPIGHWIVDFYCHEAALAVEIDGKVHCGVQVIHDRERDAWLASRGVRVIRFTAREVFTELDMVVRSIASAAKERLEELSREAEAEDLSLPPPSAEPTPPPPVAGEGRQRVR